MLTMGNGAVGGDGRTKLTYSIENVKRDEVLQNEDTVALAEGAELKTVFFSDSGVSCFYVLGALACRLVDTDVL